MTFICECCNYATPIKCNLSKHLKSHKHLRKIAEHPVETVVTPVEVMIEPETAKYSCKHCDKKFTFKQAMYRHMKTACKKTNDRVRVDSVDRLLLSRLKRVDQLTKIYFQLGEILIDEKLELQNILEVKIERQNQEQIR